MKLCNTTEKGLNQGYYGVNSTSQNANRGWQKKENRYQEHYAMTYSESELLSQAPYPNGMSKHQAAYGKADIWDDRGRSNSHQKLQNGNAVFKPQVHGHGNDYVNHSGNGMPHMQASGTGKYQGSSHSSNGMPHMQTPGTGKYQGSSHGDGYGNHSGNGMPHMLAQGTGKYQGSGYGYWGSDTRNHKMSGGMGHGFNNHTDYEPTEPYGCEETNGNGKHTNNGMMAHGQAPLRGKHTGQGDRFIKNHQANYGPGRNMGYGIPETCEYSETYYSNESHYYGGPGGGYRAGKSDHPVKGLLRKIKGSISGNKSCSDNESDSDHSEKDNETKMQQVIVSIFMAYETMTFIYLYLSFSFSFQIKLMIFVLGLAYRSG